MTAAPPFAKIVIPENTFSDEALETMEMIDRTVTAEAIRMQAEETDESKAYLAKWNGYDDADPRVYIAGRAAHHELYRKQGLTYFLNFYQRLVIQARKRDAAR